MPNTVGLDLTGVLITPGVPPAGIGALLGAWLQQTGNSVVLLGRSGLFSSDHPEVLMSDSPVSMVRCDITSREEAAGFLGPCGNHPLAGIMHAGGVLVDSILLKQTAASLRQVFAPKLAVMLSVQSLAAAQPVVNVNLFSSVSAFLGSPGQANYAAANLALGAWSQTLQGSGLAGSNIQWGAWVDVGMAHQNAAVLSRVEKSGLGLVQPRRGLAALGGVLGQAVAGGMVQVG